MVVNRRVDGSELLQTSHLSEAEHSAFSPSKRQVGIFRPIGTPAARVLKDSDPMHAGGALRYKIRKWLVNEGKFNFSIAL